VVVVEVEFEEHGIENWGDFLLGMMRMGVWIFIGEVGVVSLTRIEGIGVRLILWYIVEVMEGIGLFNSEILK